MPRSSTASPRLIAVDGPLQGRAYEVDRLPFTIGRQSDCDLAIRHPSVSRRHCILEASGEGFELVDPGSRHGTFVNGDRAHRHLLQPDDYIKIAENLFRFSPASPGTDQAAEVCRVTLAEERLNAEAETQLRTRDSIYLQPGSLETDDRTARRLSALLEISQAVHSLQRSDLLAARLAELACQALHGDRAGILLAERGEFVSAFGLDRGRPGGRFPFSRTIARRVLEEGVALLSGNVLQEEGLASQAGSLDDGPVRSLLCAPLTAAEQTRGVLYVDSRRPHRFDREQLQMACAIASIAAVALRNAELVERLEGEKRRLLEDRLEHDMIGASEAMGKVLELISRAAPSDCTVLIEGESGTGKELAARALHFNSPRCGAPFVDVNCAALTETLLESELFGHEKGAFTGALERRVGRFEQADKGTLFLDEIGEFPSNLQAKLLRALQERAFERLGGNRKIQVDLRLVAATNRDLAKEAEKGSFRSDLYYRLNVIRLRMPALRERPQDIPLLAEHFAQSACRRLKKPFRGISEEARACLMSHSWPGNVRELVNAMERAVVLGQGELILPEDLPEEMLRTSSSPQDLPSGSYHEVLDATKRQLVREAVKRAQGKYVDAAQILGLTPNYLHRLIRNLGMKQELLDP